MTRRKKWLLLSIIPIVMILVLGASIFQIEKYHMECRNIDNPKRAIAACTKLIDLKTENPEVYLDRALNTIRPGKINQSDNDKIIADFTTALGFSSEDPSMRYLILKNRGQSFELNGQYPEALSDLNAAISMNISLPKSPQSEAYRSRGITYATLEKYDLAISDLDKTIELNPQDVTAYSALSAVYLAEKQFDLALQKSNQAIAAIPKSDLFPHETGRIYLVRANVYHALHNDDLAKQDYDRAIALDPSLAYSNRAKE